MEVSRTSEGHHMPTRWTQGATGPEKPPGRPRRKAQPRRGAGGEFQIYSGRQYFRLILRADLPGVPGTAFGRGVLPGVSYPGWTVS